MPIVVFWVLAQLGLEGDTNASEELITSTV
jgi:hypothetical protein